MKLTHKVIQAEVDPEAQEMQPDVIGIETRWISS